MLGKLLARRLTFKSSTTRRYVRLHVPAPEPVTRSALFCQRVTSLYASNFLFSIQEVFRMNRNESVCQLRGNGVALGFGPATSRSWPTAGRGGRLHAASRCVRTRRSSYARLSTRAPIITAQPGRTDFIQFSGALGICTPRCSRDVCTLDLASALLFKWKIMTVQNLLKNF